MAHIIAISNHKGGCGKTTSTINIGAALAQMGKSVLLVDLDPQANLTISMGVDPAQQQHTTYTALCNGDALQPMRMADKLELVPSTPLLVDAEPMLTAENQREYKLAWLLAKIQPQYQYILLDCPPSLGLLTLNAFAAAEAVYIPLQAQYLAMQGLATLQQAIEGAKANYNKYLQLGGVFITQYDSRKVLHRNVKGLVEQQLGKAVCKTTIRDNIALAEAPTMGQTIYQYAPKSKGAADYTELAKEIHKRCSRK